MPQTGSRKLLLNDVKCRRLFQVRQKLRYFVFAEQGDLMR